VERRLVVVSADAATTGRFLRQKEQLQLGAAAATRRAVRHIGGSSLEWQRVQGDLASGKDMSALWSEAAFLRYDSLGWFDDAAPKRPVWKYREERPPRLAVVVDDCMGTDLLLPSAGLTNFCIKHRHLGRGLGCSVFMLVQSYCAQGGIARPIREKCMLLALFKMRDMNQRAKLLERPT
jgi:hypothetical protein